MILRIGIFVNRKILILRIFLRKMTILRKIVRIRLILRITIFVNTGPGQKRVAKLKSARDTRNILIIEVWSVKTKSYPGIF